MLDVLVNYGRDFLFGFATLFAIINPYGLSFIFLRRTIALSHADQKRVARKIAIYAFFVLVVSLFGGALILGFFGISISALRIAGGIVVASSGWAMLNERSHSEEEEAPRSTAGFDSVSAMAFFPLTVPLTTGPGTVATAIAIGASRPETLEGWAPSAMISLLMAASAALVVYHAYSHAARLAQLLGREGTSVVTNISAFLLMCVGVEIVITGVSGAVTDFLALRGGPA